jgi:hypothetical protein
MVHDLNNDVGAVENVDLEFVASHSNLECITAGQCGKRPR